MQRLRTHSAGVDWLKGNRDFSNMRISGPAMWRQQLPLAKRSYCSPGVFRKFLFAKRLQPSNKSTRKMQPLFNGHSLWSTKLTSIRTAVTAIDWAFGQFGWQTRWQVSHQAQRGQNAGGWELGEGNVPIHQLGFVTNTISKRTSLLWAHQELHTHANCTKHTHTKLCHINFSRNTR